MNTNKTPLMTPVTWAMCGVIAFIAGFLLVAPHMAKADMTPEYGAVPVKWVSITPSTADQTLLAAPGADYAWVIDAIAWEVTTAEANGVATIEDAAGSPTSFLYIPTDTKGAAYNQIFIGDGMLGHTNSAVQVDFSGSTAELAISVRAHKELVQ